jgi:hypothetical protein
VGIENNTDRNFKDLEEMLGSAKELKRNNRECKGILIGPLKAPCFLGAKIPSLFFLAARKTRSASGQISRRGWQADRQTLGHLRTNRLIPNLISRHDKNFRVGTSEKTIRFTSF